MYILNINDKNNEKNNNNNEYTFGIILKIKLIINKLNIGAKIVNKYIYFFFFFF